MYEKICRILKRLLFRFKKYVIGAHRVTAHTVDGDLKLAACSDIAESVFADAFEKDQRAAVRSLIRSDDICLDVGANVGVYTILFGKRIEGARGKVLAFEPSKENFAQLLENVGRQSSSGSITTFESALGDTEKMVDFVDQPETGGVYNCVKPMNEQGIEDNGTVRKSQMTTVDAVLGEYEPKNAVFIKIDVEGFQHNVLKGCATTFTNFPNLAVLVELNEKRSQLFGFSVKETLGLFDSANFIGYQIQSKGFLKPVSSQEIFERVNGQLSVDVLFIKKGSVYEKRNQSNNS